MAEISENANIESPVEKPDEPPAEKPDESTAGKAQPETTSPTSQSDDFARQAEEAQIGLLAEFWDFLKHEKKWWLTPIIIVILLLALLTFLQPVAAPFIYPFF